MRNNKIIGWNLQNSGSKMPLSCFLWSWKGHCYQETHHAFHHSASPLTLQLLQMASVAWLRPSPHLYHSFTAGKQKLVWALISSAQQTHPQITAGPTPGHFKDWSWSPKWQHQIHLKFLRCFWQLSSLYEQDAFPPYLLGCSSSSFWLKEVAGSRSVTHTWVMLSEATLLCKLPL